MPTTGRIGIATNLHVETRAEYWHHFHLYTLDGLYFGYGPFNGTRPSAMASNLIAMASHLVGTFCDPHGSEFVPGTCHIPGPTPKSGPAGGRSLSRSLCTSGMVVDLVCVCTKGRV